MIERMKKAARKSASNVGGSFRQRFDDLEARREKLLTRVHTLGTHVANHPGHKRVLTLLNQTFRRSALAQRAAVLEAATFLADVLESLGPTIGSL